MKYPQVSVLMPVYNSERYLAEAVESILTQTFQDFEFLIFDDGSRDTSPVILQRYSSLDKRIHFFAKPHKGYVRWLNEGVRAARGKYIARMDADDISLPQRLARQVQYLGQNSDCVAVGCDTLVIDPDGDPIGNLMHDAGHEAIESELLSGVGGGGVIAHPTSMMRRSALLAIDGYREEFEPIEDFDLWLRLAEQGRLANIKEILLKYRFHHSNVTYTQAERQEQLANAIITEARLRRGLKPLTHSIWSYTPPTLLDRHHKWAWQAAGSGYYRTALKHASLSVREAPLSFRSWFVLLTSVVPRWLRQFMKTILVSAGLRRSTR